MTVAVTEPKHLLRGAFFILKRRDEYLLVKSMTKIAIITLVIALMAIGIAGYKKVEEIPTTETAWSLKLTGATTETMTQEEFEGVADRIEFNIKEIGVYSGIPLWRLCGQVDDEVQQGEGAFNNELAVKGYGVTILATDGYSITLSSKTIARKDDIILANKLNGQSLSQSESPLRLVGTELRSSQMVRNVVEIHLDLP